jgi:hypothetical protein
MATFLRGMPIRLLAVALAVTAVLLPIPVASAYASGPVSAFSISISGADGNASYFPGEASVNMTQTWNAGTGGDYEAVQINVSSTSGTPLYFFDFATANGSNQRFGDGYYPWAQNWPGNSQGRPGISVTGGPNPCGGSSGSFEVRDIARSALEITKLWIVFTRTCADSPGQVDIGELRIGYPPTAYETSPEVADWPWSTIYPGQAAEDVPVTVRLGTAKAVTAGTPSITGTDAADFPLRQQNCTGALTSSGCTIWVGFTPKAPGPRHATLVIPTSAGTTYVALNGLGGVGTSNWTVSTNWPGTPAHETIPSVSAGNPYSVISQGLQPVSGGNAEVWTAEFALHTGQPFRVGTTYNYQNVTSPPFTMSIAQADGGCELSSGSVTINDLAMVGPDHDVSRMNAVLKAGCQSSTPYSVTATMRFHEAADVTPPSPVTGLKAERSGGQVKLTWTKPTASDLAGVIVNWYSAKHAPSIWSAGNIAYVGKDTSVTFSGPASQPVSISAWAYDTTGNISSSASVSLS